MEQTSRGHWYQWLKSELEERGYAVWVPNLPHSDHPDTEEMTEFLLANKDWDFNDNLLIGHSSGSVEVLYLLQALPPATKVKAAVMVSSFDRIVPGMEAQHDRMFTQDFDFAKIKNSCKEKLVFVHGSDDPWCPLKGPEVLSQEVDGELVVVDGGGHFSTTLDPKYNKFPELVKILEERSLL